MGFRRLARARLFFARALLCTVLAASVIPALTGCSESLKDIAGARGDLLAGRRPTSKTGISQTERLTDALITIDGDNWLTDVTTAFKDKGEVVWDLGKSESIACAFLQGDNNDTYFLDGSDDRTTWNALWAAAPVKTPGMQSRSITNLNARARYVRLRATGGDGLYSVAEVALYSSCDPTAFPAHFEQRTGVLEGGPSAVPWRLAIVVASLLLLAFRPRPGAAGGTVAGSSNLVVPVGVITMLSGVLMDTLEMALVGLAILAWPMARSLFEPTDTKAGGGGKTSGGKTSGGKTSGGKTSGGKTSGGKTSETKPGSGDKPGGDKPTTAGAGKPAAEEPKTS